MHSDLCKMKKNVSKEFFTVKASTMTIFHGINIAFLKPKSISSFQFRYDKSKSFLLVIQILQTSMKYLFIQESKSKLVKKVMKLKFLKTDTKNL